MSTREEMARSILSRLMSPDPDDVALSDALVEEEPWLLGAFAEALPPVAPSADARVRLLAAVSPFAAFDEAIAELFQTTVDAVRAQLASFHDTSLWHAIGAGARLRHILDAPPALAGADVGYVIVEEGVDFPAHTHDGEEHNLVLAGVLEDETGQRYGPGARFTLPAGSRHLFRAAEGPLVFAVVVWGVRFDDHEAVPGH